MGAGAPPAKLRVRPLAPLRGREGMCAANPFLQSCSWDHRVLSSREVLFGATSRRRPDGTKMGLMGQTRAGSGSTATSIQRLQPWCLLDRPPLPCPLLCPSERLLHPEHCPMLVRAQVSRAEVNCHRHLGQPGSDPQPLHPLFRTMRPPCSFSQWNSHQQGLVSQF